MHLNCVALWGIFMSPDFPHELLSSFKCFSSYCNTLKETVRESDVYFSLTLFYARCIIHETWFPYSWMCIPYLEKDYADVTSFFAEIWINWDFFFFRVYIWTFYENLSWSTKLYNWLYTFIFTFSLKNSILNLGGNRNIVIMSINKTHKTKDKLVQKKVEYWISLM